MKKVKCFWWMVRPHLKLERGITALGSSVIAGVDEVGRGAWAGPLVASAVILPIRHKIYYLGIQDSKQLGPEQREAIFAKLVDLGIDFGVGIVQVPELNRFGLGPGTRLAMQRAVQALKTKPDFILVDGRGTRFTNIPSQGVVGGDRTSLSIAAASIIAKVTRDQLMIKIGTKKYPQYNFELHKGYGTKLHQTKLKELGVCAWHRKIFRPIQGLKS